MPVQSVINYIERNRAGLARLIAVEALRACGHEPQVIEAPETSRIRNSIEVGLLIAMQRPGLQEPQPVEEAQRPTPPPDVAGSPTQEQERASEEEPAPAPEPEREPEEEPATEPQPERQEEPGIPGEEILEQRTPPPVPRRRR